MKIFSVRQTVLPALLVLSPVVFAADEQTMIVSAAPQVVSELDTPAAVSVVDGEEMRLATPRINLSESLTSVPGLQVQNRQNYAQDIQLSIRGFGSRSTYGIRGIRLYVDGIPATMPDGQEANIQHRFKQCAKMWKCCVAPSLPCMATRLAV
ncbi:TonB-dependent receptor plug domain-containing protein [Escherichia coli]